MVDVHNLVRLPLFDVRVVGFLDELIAEIVPVYQIIL